MQKLYNFKQSWQFTLQHFEIITCLQYLYYHSIYYLLLYQPFLLCLSLRKTLAENLQPKVNTLHNIYNLAGPWQQETPFEKQDQD